MTSGPRESDERLDGRWHGDRLGLGRASPPHRDDDDAALGGEQPRDVPGDRGLADALPGADDRDRGELERLERRRIEPEVRPHVRESVRQDTACEREALDGPEHRLVGEIDDDLGPVALERRLDVLRQRHAVALAPAELLRSSDENRRDELVRKLGERVADDGRIVLAVDDREGPHVLAVTSSSIAPVNLAYSSVSSENETSLTSPWNGCRRQMSTLRSATSMTL